MGKTLHKVTCFVLRLQEGEPHLLLIQHPNAGIQIPAGTVEVDETPEEGALREAHEETGLSDFQIDAYLGSQDDIFPPDYFFLLQPATAYARPDPASFDWIHLPRAILVQRLRQEGGFSQVSYTVHDRWPDPEYASMQITGWVRDEVLTQSQTRHFFRFSFTAETPESWQVFTDNHTFTLFWAPLSNLPDIIPEQAKWLKMLPEAENFI